MFDPDPIRSAPQIRHMAAEAAQAELARKAAGRQRAGEPRHSLLRGLRALWGRRPGGRNQ